MTKMKAMNIFHDMVISAHKSLGKLLFLTFIAFFVSASPTLAWMENSEGTTLKNSQFVTLVHGEASTISTTYKNTGKAVWRAGRVNLETGDFLRSSSKLKNSNWLSYYRIVAIPRDVKPGESVTLSISFTAPTDITGDIQQNFQLVDNGEQPIKGTTLRLFVTVGKPAVVVKKPTQSVVAVAPKPTTSLVTPVQYSPSTVTQSSTVKVSPSSFSCSATGVLTTEQIAQYVNCNTALVENDPTNGQSTINAADRMEPMMRIGVFNTAQAQRVSSESVVDIYADTEQLFSGIDAGDVITLGFDFGTKQYSAQVAGLTKYSMKQLRVVPRVKNSVATLLDYRNGAVGSGTTKDNRYRNIIEMQYSTKTCKLWIINELPLTYYLKGLGETSAASPVEFQKVMLAAARTYAMYHYNRGVDFKVKDGSTRHADEHFHLDSTYDQVYRGYGSEERIKTLVQAENETRGLVITYQDKVIVTPYFSRSDGRTRSWTEVWGGAGMPWLQGVAVPQDAGQTLWGHGVGMSARGALLMAVNDKKSWDTIIKYFYTGVEIKKIY